MARAVSRLRREAAERLEAEGRYDWAAGETLSAPPDWEEAARNERRMAERYRAWAAANPVTYAPNMYESASRHYKGMPLETVNPVDDTVIMPPPRYDERLQKWTAPKNVFDGNVLGRRRFLFEIDGMSIEGQKALLEPLLKARVIQRVVFSGNKSLHCVIEEEDEPGASPGEAEYKWAWRFMAYKYFGDGRFRDLSLPMKIDNTFKEVVDNRCGHPSRTTRSPFAIRKDEATGWEPAEQKLLYFEGGRHGSLWRRVYRRMKEREGWERERMRRRARQDAYRNLGSGKKTPNEAARRFMGRDMSDGWKHSLLPSAVGSLLACGYTPEEVALVFSPYGRELQVFAAHVCGYLEGRGRK